MHYAVSPTGEVRSYRQKTAAEAMAREMNGFYASDASSSLVNIPTPLLVTLHNLVRPERPVTRFADRATAEKRLQGVLEVLAKPGLALVTDETEEKSAKSDPSGDAASSSADEEMVEVDDDSPLTAEEFTPDDSKTPEENEAMATKARSARPKKLVKKSAAKKSAAKRGPRAEANPITDATVRKVIKMRAEGKGWPEILKEFGEKSNNFIHRIRPLMKKIDKSSVLPIGPGSPKYGKAKPKK